MKAKYEIYRDSKEEYRFRLIAPNGEIIGVSEGYASKDSCMNGIASVKKMHRKLALLKKKNETVKFH